MSLPPAPEKWVTNRGSAINQAGEEARMEEYLGWVVGLLAATILVPVAAREIYERRQRRIDRARSRRRTDKIRL